MILVKKKEIFILKIHIIKHPNKKNNNHNNNKNNNKAKSQNKFKVKTIASLMTTNMSILSPLIKKLC